MVTQRKPKGKSSPTEIQYEALAFGACVADRPAGILRYTGEDALDLLNRLSTNYLIDLEVESGVETALISNKGRIIDLLFVLRLSDHLLIFTSVGNETRVREWIEFYTIVETANGEDITGQTATVSLVGPHSAEKLSILGNESVTDLRNGRSLEINIEGTKAKVVRRDIGATEAFDIVSSYSEGAAVRSVLTRACSVYAEPGAFELFRIKQGVPIGGAELTESYNPLEAGLKHLINYTKGCYVGQEVIARLTSYDKVQKHLVRLKWDTGTLISPGAKLMEADKQVGIVTSAIRDPRLLTGHGLGYVRKQHSLAGTILVSESGDHIEVIA